VRLAIALLKDKNGRIDLDVPVEGSVDSPEFSYGKIFWQALKKILTGLVTAPFRAIGRMFGNGGEDLDLVGFSSGSSELLPAERETLAKISAELANRAEISIEVGGRYDPQTDADALRRGRLEARIDAERNGTITIEGILEALYAETFSVERLEAERAKFQPHAVSADAGAKKAGRNRPPRRPQPPSTPRGSTIPSGPSSWPPRTWRGRASSPGRDRAAAIVAALTAPGGLDPARVKTGEAKPVTRKKQGSDLVASEMTMSAED